MEQGAIVRRLDLIIVLLLGIIAILLWPMLPRILFYGGVIGLIGLAVAMVWGLSRGGR